jgi:FMN-dependent NADH-azoreductase
MASLLKIDISPRFDYSISRALGEKFLSDWKTKNPGGTVVERDLAKNPLPFVDLGWVLGAFTDPATHGDDAKKSMKISNELVDELLAAEEVVITTPMYNFAPPSAFKSWIDHIVRFNRTFSASYEGLAKGRKLTVIVAAGGNYSTGSGMEGMDFFTPYVKFIFGFIGITEVEFIYGFGTNAVAQGQITKEEYLAKHTVTA